MARTTKTLALAVGLLAAAGSGRAQLGMGDSPQPTAPGSTSPTLNVAVVDQTYRFSSPAGTVTKSRYFDLVKDTPNVVNAGQILSPGGTCMGMSYVTQYFYERVVYPVLSAGTAVREPDLGVPGPVDRTNLESNRLRAFSTTGAGKDKFQRLSASAQPNHSEWGNGTTTGDPKACHDKWKAHIGNDQYALGALTFWEETGQWAHAVNLSDAQDGVAVSGTATTGPRVTRFRIVDPNQNYSAATVRPDDYIMYFHDAKRLAFSPEIQSVYEWPGSTLQSGTYALNDKVGYREPFGWWARWNANCRDTTQGANLRWGEDLSQPAPKAKGPKQPNVILDEGGNPIASGEEFLECPEDPVDDGAPW